MLHCTCAPCLIAHVWQHALACVLLPSISYSCCPHASRMLGIMFHCMLVLMNVYRCSLVVDLSFGRACLQGTGQGMQL